MSIFEAKTGRKERRVALPKALIPLKSITALKTRFLREAEKAGAEIVSGLEVLVYQGAKAFELWTGCEAPVDVMREAALKALGVIRDEG